MDGQKASKASTAPRAMTEAEARVLAIAYEWHTDECPNVLMDLHDAIGRMKAGQTADSSGDGKAE